MKAALSLLASAATILVAAQTGSSQPEGPSAPAAQANDGAAIASVLDAFHEAASRADEQQYFALFAPEGVFIGTDASERWDVGAFRAYAHPFFSQGRGWTYHPGRRHIDLVPGAPVAWFDEALHSEKYGVCRGTGVLRKIDGRWRICQYHLTVPVPNDLLEKVVAMIRDASK